MEPAAMGPRSGRCPTCSAPVEPGWLTCRACGAILAAVRRPVAAATGSLGVAGSPPLAPARGSTQGVPGQAEPSTAPAEPAPPSTPAVHTAAIPAALPPPARQELGPNEWYSARAEADAGGVGGAADASPREPKAGVFADLPLAVPPTAGGRVASIGLAAIAIAFFLPWSPLLPGISLFDAWGFSRSSRVLVFLADLAVLALAILPVGLSVRVRTGWLPTFFGIFVVGVFWERVDSISVVGPGAWLFVIGGALAFGGGLLTVLSREPPPGPSA
jgi:hypothetical protein